MSKDAPPPVTRRQVLQGATLIGATIATSTATAAAPAIAPAATSVAREAFENLTAHESDLLEVIVDRLIPTDATGPGAKEARVAHYIDRALGGGLQTQRSAYTSGLEALDRYARSSRGKPFLELPSVDQESVLIDVETGGATGFAGSSAQFFAMLLSHTRQGMFGDPYYGGNVGFVGWDLVGYPGVRTAVMPADQKALEAGELKVLRNSAYDIPSFNKATAKADTNVHDHALAADLPHGH